MDARDNLSRLFFITLKRLPPTHLKKHSPPLLYPTYLNLTEIAALFALFDVFPRCDPTNLQNFKNKRNNNSNSSHYLLCIPLELQ